MRIAIFCEDDFDSVAEVEDEKAAAAFFAGFDAGAKAYGGGKWRLYLFPRDESTAINDEHIGEVMRAHEEIERLDAKAGAS